MYRFSIIIFLLLITFSLANSQDTSETYFFYNEEVTRDTVCFKYNFVEGDSIYYRKAAYDSITIDYDKPLLRLRYEKWLLTCDSVSKEGNFHLAMSLQSYIAYESKDSIKNIERTSSPWIGRTSFIEIDSLGNRISVAIDDTSSSALTPGSAFEPHFLFYFRDTCKAVESSWSVNSIDTLAENGYPFPIINRALLYKAEADIDTLDYESSRFRFISTAKGSFSVLTKETKVRTTAVLNGFGRVTISKEYGIPIHFFNTLEQKLKITMPGEIETPGWHYTRSDTTIELFKPSESRPKKMKE